MTFLARLINDTNWLIFSAHLLAVSSTPAYHAEAIKLAQINLNIAYADYMEYEIDQAIKEGQLQWVTVQN